MPAAVDVGRDDTCHLLHREPHLRGIGALLERRVGIERVRGRSANSAPVLDERDLEGPEAGVDALRNFQDVERVLRVEQLMFDGASIARVRRHPQQRVHDVFAGRDLGRDAVGPQLALPAQPLERFRTATGSRA
jgi:hypothetical protein